jgi:hypothetical protein
VRPAKPKRPLWGEVVLIILTIVFVIIVIAVAMALSGCHGSRCTG